MGGKNYGAWFEGLRGIVADYIGNIGLIIRIQGVYFLSSFVTAT